MSNEILVPSLGESVTEATVAKWLKNIGDSVNTDEPLVELETDKVNVEVPSPLSGTLTAINVNEGDTVEVGALLGVVDKNGQKSTITKNDNTKIKDKKIKNKNDKIFPISKDQKEEQKNITKIKKQEVLKLEDPVEENVDNEKPLILENLVGAEDSVQENLDLKKNYLSPSVRKIVEENKINISNIKGSGKDGRIAKGDLLVLMGNTPQSSSRKISHGPEERVKMTRLRVTIARRLKEAQENAAMLTTFNEVDMKNVIQMREDYKEDFQSKYLVKLGFMSFFVKATVVALKNYPAINSEIDGNDIIYKNYYNIGIAVGTEKGLVVPVLKNADELSFAEIEKNIFSLSNKAKEGKIVIDDLQGGSFTISNGGIYGSMLSTPILNPPQTGVLGMHNIVDRAVVKNEEILIRPIMYLALSYDHRIVDGKEAVSFLKTIKDLLEEPRRLFLDL